MNRYTARSYETYKNIDSHKTNKIVILKKTLFTFARWYVCKILFYDFPSIRNETSVEFFPLS
jgi:hypothetical protein